MIDNKVKVEDNIIGSLTREIDGACSIYDTHIREERAALREEHDLFYEYRIIQDTSAG